MPGLLGVLDLAGRAMQATQRGVRTAGHNIANADNPDFTRQRQLLGAVRPINTQGHYLGAGVEQLGIQRINNVFIEKQLLSQLSSFGSTNVQADALSQLEGVFNEVNGNGLSAGLDAFYRAFSDLASATTPGGPAERAALRGAAQSLLSTIHALDSQLRDQYSAVNEAIGSALPEVNQLVRQINDLNEQIVPAETIAAANDLRDMRDARLRDLASLVDITHFEQPNGSVHVSLSNGLALIEGGFARQLVAVPDTSNPIDPRSIQVHYQDGASSFDVTSVIGGGELGGMLRARDTSYPDAIRALDTVAFNLGTSVNAVHQLGTDLGGNTGGDFFAPLAAVEDAARSLSLAAPILASTDAIAAGLSAAAGDNRNALALAALRDTPAPIFLPGDPPGPASGPSMSVIERVSSLVTGIGEQARTLTGATVQQNRVLEDLQTRRDEISAVSIDEEVAHLVQLQAAFQANARVISLVDDLMQDVLDLL